MPKVMKRREDASEKLAGLGLKVVTAISDRRSGSYAVGYADGSGYFAPTFPNEDAVLDWAARNMPRIERYVRKGEPLEPQEFIAHLVSAAALESGDDPQAFADALAPRMEEIRAEANVIGERDLDGLLDEIEDARVPPAEILQGLSDVLAVEFPTPASQAP